MADLFRLEHAKTWRSICKECKCIIPENSLRLGKGTTDVKSWYHLLCYPCEAENVETFLKENVADNTTGGMLSIKRDFQNISNAMKKASALRKTKNCGNHRTKGRNAHKKRGEKVLVKRGRVPRVLVEKKKRVLAKDNDNGNDVDEVSVQQVRAKEDRKKHKSTSLESTKTNCRMWRDRTFKRGKSSKERMMAFSAESSRNAYPSPLRGMRMAHSSSNFEVNIESVSDDELNISRHGQEEQVVEEKENSCSVDTIIMDDLDDDDSIFEDISGQKDCDEEEEEEEEEEHSQPLVLVQAPATPPRRIDTKQSFTMEADVTEKKRAAILDQCYDDKTSQQDAKKKSRTQDLSQRKLDVDDSSSYSSVSKKRRINGDDTPVSMQKKKQQKNRTPTCIIEEEKEDVLSSSSPPTSPPTANKRRLEIATFVSSSNSTSSDSTSGRKKKKRKTYAKRKKWGRIRKGEGSSSSSMKPMLTIKVTKYS